MITVATCLFTVYAGLLLDFLSRKNPFNIWGLTYILYARNFGQSLLVIDGAQYSLHVREVGLSDGNSCKKRNSYTAGYKLTLVELMEKTNNCTTQRKLGISKKQVHERHNNKAILGSLPKFFRPGKE